MENPQTLHEGRKTGILAVQGTGGVHFSQVRVCALSESGNMNKREDRPRTCFQAPPNFLCLSCFALNKHCHCPKEEESVICIGTKLRLPRRTESKQKWIKKLKKFPHILKFIHFKGVIGGRYEVHK